MAYERITVSPNRMSGLPCIRDTRVTVSAVLGQLAAGLTIPELLADFPYLDGADVLAALEFAAAAVQARKRPSPLRLAPVSLTTDANLSPKMIDLLHAMDPGFVWGRPLRSGYRRSECCESLTGSALVRQPPLAA